MSTLKLRLSEFIKTSMKSGDKEQLQYARNLHAAIRKKEVDDRVDLGDAEVQKIAGSLLKQRQESIEQFTKGGRQDLVAKEQAEAAFLSSFLPAQLSDAELGELVSTAMAESGAKGPADIGKVMKALVPKVQGRADGKRVNQAVTERLKAGS